MKFQVMSTDEYGQTSILSTLGTVESAIQFMRDQVTDLNFSNALTTADKFKSIEAYSIDFLESNGDIDVNRLYSGNTTDGRPRMLVSSNGSYDKEVVPSVPRGKRDPVTEDNMSDLRVFLGVNEKEMHYLSTVKNVTVDDLSHELLEGKTAFFIRVV